ncbi:MAG: hypothetical protein COT74_07180 [Bdellovibrionales bacterium CG10_big_fil_rev_8_21_14_0_10_45_34]|nr:MAG: hypothetical protein COT74_07180 [Bdellovibrionales bacterium CG10_big_fil_rev_8_21_14_0_10_45_34]
MSAIQLKYRTDIDGLRALSVLAVILYHAEIPGFKGGFLGVDVFFVISGYLITSMIIAGTTGGNTFSFRQFYIRRARRLLPSFFAILALSSLFGYLILSPNHLEQFGRSLLASLIGLANVFFLTESGYFETQNIFRPLLHIWSLAVEEQFYLVWPFILWVLRGKALSFWIVLLFGLSLAANYAFMHLEAARFYLTHFRIFELLCGAFISVLPLRRGDTAWRTDLSVFTGILLIVGSFLFFNSDTNHPSLLTLFPCIGTALFIYFGPSKLSSKIFSSPPLRYIGQRSYTIYLVHWPLIVYYRYLVDQELNLTEKSFLCLMSILIALPVFRYLEDPIRLGQPLRFLKRNIPIVTMGILTFILLGITGATLVISDGAGWRVKSYSEEWKNNSLYGGEFCPSPCYLNEQADTEEIYVVGDSFSRQLAYGLRKHFPDQKFKIFDHRKCSFFSLTWIAWEAQSEKDCLEKRDRFLSEIRERRPKIIFANHWVRETYFRESQSEKKFEFRKFGLFTPDSAEFIFQEIRHLQIEFQLPNPILIGNPPSIGNLNDLEMCLSRPTWLQVRQKHADCTRVLRASIEERAFLSKYAPKNLMVLNLFEPFCNSIECQTIEDKGLLFFDQVHLSGLGSARAINYFRPILDKWIQEK